MPRLLLAILFALTPLQAHSQAATLLPGEEPLDMVYRLLDATLPIFLEHALDENGVGHPNARLMFALRSPPDSDNAHFLWVTQIRRDADGRYHGILVDGAADNPALPAGGAVSASDVAIADWGFVAPDGRRWGFISARAQAIVQDNPAFLDTLMPDIVPPDWK